MSYLDKEEANHTAQWRIKAVNHIHTLDALYTKTKNEIPGLVFFFCEQFLTIKSFLGQRRGGTGFRLQ